MSGNRSETSSAGNRPDDRWQRRPSDIPSYNFRETAGWLWRNIRGVRKADPGGIEQLPRRSVLNAIHPRIRIGLIGDIMDMRHKTLHISAGVREFLHPCDFLIGNLEGTLAGSGRPSPTAQSHDPETLAALAECFPPERTYLSVANNHAGDFHRSIFWKSLAGLEERGFHVFGLARKPWANIAGQIRVVGASMWSNRPCREIAAFASLDAHSRPDLFTLAFPHWGYELERFPRPAIVREGERLLQDYDAVVGHHPHVPQPLTARNQGDRLKLIAFSLGDFCTGLPFKKYHWGIICKLEIGPGCDGSWRLGAVDWRYTRAVPAAGAVKVALVSDLLL